MSSNLIELLQSSIVSTVDSRDLQTYLESCVEHGVFYSKDNIGIVLKTINTTLNSSFDKDKGLILLLAFLPQISVEVYTTNAISWMNQCLKLISHKGDNTDALCFKVLSKLLHLSVKFPDIYRDTAKEVVPKLLLEHIKRRTNSQVSEEFLECLQSCMSNYPGPSGDFKTDTMCVLLSSVERPAAVVEAAAACIPLLARLGGGGKMGALHRAGWNCLQHGLIYLLQTLLNNIYQYVDCVPELDTVPPVDPGFVLQPVLEKSALYKTQRLARQFVSVALYLGNMLLQEYPVPKGVTPDAILDVISHTQKPTLSALGTTREVLPVISVLPSLQMAALSILESLILCMSRNLVPRAGLVNHLLSQALLWTDQQHKEWRYGLDKPYSESRYTVYSCLQTWLTTVGSACGVESVMDRLLPVFLADIHAQRPTVRLQVGSTSKSGKGKKKRQMLVNVDEQIEKLGNSEANHRLCEKALSVLTQLVQSSAPFLKADTLKSIQDTVLTVCVQLPVPYTNSLCLTSLYQLLLALCLANHPQLQPPLAPAMAVFTAGVHHTELQVKSTSLSALSSLEKIVHPTSATLYFPLPIEPHSPLIRSQVEPEQEVEQYEHHDNDKQFQSPAKKIRVEEEDDTSSLLVLVDSEEESSVKSLIIDVVGDKDEGNMYDDSPGCNVEAMSEVSGQSYDVIAQSVSMKSVTSLVETPVSEDLIIDLRQHTKTIDTFESNIESVHCVNRETCENRTNYTNKTSTIDLLPNEDVADVSEMLLDFNDEVINHNLDS